jgi:uncharacterized protein YqjF (DUF2071 family)
MSVSEGVPLVGGDEPLGLLTAVWRHLAMLNFEVDPSLLERFLPAGTEPDGWNGKSFVSVVGFRFLNTRLRRWGIPFHRDFEDVNLRFYVRREVEEGWRHGVVFVKQIVPRRAIAVVARWIYNENFVALPMRHALTFLDDEATGAEYGWYFAGRWNRLSVSVAGKAARPEPGSEEEFIAERYWGYSAQRDGRCLEYRVEHPPWRIRRAREFELDCDVERLYGEPFVGCLTTRPSSAFLAEGSGVTVYQGTKIG